MGLGKKLRKRIGACSVTEIMGLKKQSEKAKIVIIDGKQFVTNGVWEYGTSDDYTRARYLPIGQLGWKVDCGSIPLWGGAALYMGEEEILRDIPRIVGGWNIINLGDLRGGSAILLAQGLEHNKLEGHVYTVDAYLFGDSKRRDDQNRELGRTNRIKTGTDHRITMIENTTTTALLLFTDRYSFIFIDADHSYEGIRDDWINYSPLIDGMVAFHDTNQEPAERVIEEYVVKDWKLEYWVNRIKIFSRR